MDVGFPNSRKAVFGFAYVLSPWCLRILEKRFSDSHPMASLRPKSVAIASDCHSWRGGAFGLLAVFV